MVSDRKQLETYISKCAPPFSWDKDPDVDFFRLMALIWKQFDEYKPHINKFINETALEQTRR